MEANNGNIFSCFFGHRYIDNIMEVEDALYEHIKNLVLKKYYVDFFVGRNGDFDRCVSSVINRVKREIRDYNSSHTLVLPYVTAEYINNMDSFDEYYDEVYVYEISSKIHPKAVIGLRNNEMVIGQIWLFATLKRKTAVLIRRPNMQKSKVRKLLIFAENKPKSISNNHIVLLATLIGMMLKIINIPKLANKNPQVKFHLRINFY